MYIESVPNRDSPPAVLLRESFREDGKVRKRTLANLSCLSAEVIEGLKVLLRGGVAVPSAEEVFVVERSLPHGHVAAVLGSARGCGAAVWFGPKGFASVVYGLLVLNSGVLGAQQAFDLIAVCIALSIAAHSSTDVPVARLFHVEAEAGLPSPDGPGTVRHDGTRHEGGGRPGTRPGTEGGSGS